jgi:predicted permease
MGRLMLPVLRWVSDTALAESIAGDLEEQRRQRAARSRVLAALWFWRRWLSIAMFLGWARMKTTLIEMFRGGPRRSGRLGRDVRYSLRALQRARWYALTVIGVIALGMTLATTVFAVVDGVLFRPLPYPQADRLFAVVPGFTDLPPAPSTTSSSLGRRASASPLDVVNWQAAAPELSITGFRAQRWSGMGEGVNEVPYGFAHVQPNFFDTIGVQPRVGGFTAADFDHEDSVQPVVITHELWQSRFHGMRDVIGQTYIGDPAAGWGFRVVGVMPEGFVFPSSRTTISVIAPLVVDRTRANDPSYRALDVIARVPAMSPADARAKIEAGVAMTTAVFPARGPRPATWSERSWRMNGPYDRVTVSPLATELGSTERPLFRAVFLGAVVLLALAAINVSGLMAARGLERAHELSLRRALGASGVAIARLVFVEAAVPIVTGSIAGLMLAVPFLQVGARLLPEELVLLTPQAGLAIDARVVIFVAVSALVLAVATMIWPLRRALRVMSSQTEGTRGSARSRSIGRSVLITSQVAGALVLTLGGGLLVTSILTVYSHEPPIRTDGIVVLGAHLRGPGSRMNKAPERTPRIKTLIEAIRRVPGVEGVALTDQQTLVGGNNPSWFAVPAQASNARLMVAVQAVTSDFYRVLEPELVLGRFPTDAELDADAPVIVVSEAVARAYWPDASPLGQLLSEQPDMTPYAVIGVVRDIRWNSWDTEVASIYGPYARLSRFPHPTVFIRTRMSVSETLAVVVPEIDAVDPQMSTWRAGTLNELFADTVRPRRFQSWLFGSFAVAALVIVGAGILGLIAMSTARRTREMGIRLALGSTREALVRLLLREQLTSVGAGVVLGSLVSAWAVRFVRAYLYEITPYDPRVWALAIVVIVVTTAAGTLIPSLRASKTDPVQALRVE